MGLTFDFSNIGDPEKIHEGGGTRVKPGRGMGVIKRFSEYTGAKGQAHELDIEIVAWSDPESLALTHTENVFHTDGSEDYQKGSVMKRLTCIAMAAGLFNANDAKEWQRQGLQPEMDMEKLIDRPVFFELVNKPKKSDPTKSYTQISNYGLAIFHIKDPRCKDWPKNQMIWNANAAKVGDWIETAKAAAPAAKAQTHQTAKPTNAAASVDALFGNV